MARRRGYRTSIYQIGNSADHTEILRFIPRFPGLVVLHEYMLHHLMRLPALSLAGATAFVEEMRYCYGRRGEVMARQLLAAAEDDEIWSYPLFERLVDASLGVIVHSQATKQRIHASRPLARVSVVPHPLSLHGQAIPDADQKAAFRAGLGLPPDALLVASFGEVTPSKGVDVALRAFRRLRQTHDNAFYLLVGEVSSAYRELSEELAGELGRGVVPTGRLSLEKFLEFMAQCDVAVNLRFPTGGETSGSCVRMLGLGIAVIVTNVGWFAEIPDDCCAKVDPGADEEELLAACLLELADNPGLRRAMGSNASRWCRRHHSLAASARAYAGVVEELDGSEAKPYRPVPPLASYPESDVSSALVAEISGAVAELGVTEEHVEVLEDLARTLVELDLDQ